MKKLLSLLLALLLCLSVIGCNESEAPTGEVDLPAASMAEASDLHTATEAESVIANGSVLGKDEVESPVESIVKSIPESTASTEKEPTVSASPPKAEESISSTVSVANKNTLTAPESSILSPKEEPTITDVVTFSPPPTQTIFIHDEFTLEDFTTWLNSEEALTEEDGAFRDAVNFYRQRGNILSVSLPESVTSEYTYSFYSSGKLFILLKGTNSYLAINPIDEAEKNAASNGIVSYFAAKGETILSSATQISTTLTEQNLKKQFIACKPTIATRVTDAVYEIESYKRWDETMIYSRYLHWFEDGFHVHYAFPTTDTMEDALVIDKSRLSQLQFEDVKLTAAPSVVSTPLETE